MLDLDESEIASLIENPRPVDENRTAVMDVLAGLHDLVVAETQGIASPRSFIYRFLAYSEQAGMQLPSALRVVAGGDVATLSAELPEPETVLGAIARDLFPVTLAPADESAPRTAFLHDELHWLSVLLNHHPLTSRFEEVVLEDAVFDRLFSRDDPATGRSGALRLSFGMGRGIQLTMLAYDLLTAAHATLRVADRFEYQAFVDQAVNNVAVLRRLLLGESVDVVARYGLAGIRLEGEELDTPWGRLRRQTDGETEILGRSVVSHTTDAVIETRFPLQLEVVASLDFEDDEFRRTARGAFAAQAEAIRLISLSLLLATDQAPPLATAQTWTLIDNPVGQHPLLSWRRDPRPLVTHTIRTADASAMADWVARVDREYHPSIAVAVHRLLLALTSRDDPSDALIDAVIALENLFAGTDQGELVFRISAACAFALEPIDAAAREQLQRDVKRLYERRSKIVHGASFPDPADVEADRERAVNLCIRSLRRLFASTRGLLADRNRGTKLILGLATTLNETEETDDPAPGG